jgi:hypothetical protein
MPAANSLNDGGTTKFICCSDHRLTAGVEAMTVPIADGWQFDVEEGPEWLFLCLRRSGHDAAPEPPVATRAWEIAQQSRRTRIVFELCENVMLSSFLVGQLILLHKRAQIAGATFRIQGFSTHNYTTLQMLRVADRFPNYAGRENAVLGHLA